MDIASPNRPWWYSFWFAVLAILVALGGIALTLFLLAWAILPGFD